MEQKTQKQILTIPIAIIIAGALIGGAILYRTSATTVKSGTPIQAQAKQQQPTGNIDAMLPITSEDHVRGNISAQVKIVEYSDTECPFCKRFHTTLQDIMKEYGSTDKVAWVYRHNPIDQLHSKARKEAIATECAASLGGNDVFWKYLDRLMEITPGNNKLDLAELPKIAEYVGLNKAKFNACLESDEMAKKVEMHAQNARATGGRGTPWSIVVAPSGKKYPLSGAQSFDSVKQLVELASQDK